jgi:glycine dehydrogenase subunit 2
MIEPTETEPKERLDGFIEAMRRIAEEAATEPDLLHEAPHGRPVRRLDEVRAVKQPIVRYRFEEQPERAEHGLVEAE